MIFFNNKKIKLIGNEIRNDAYIYFLYRFATFIIYKNKNCEFVIGCSNCFFFTLICLISKCLKNADI